MKRILQWLGVLTTVTAVTFLAWPNGSQVASDWVQSVSVPVRAAGEIPQLVVFSAEPHGRLNLWLLQQFPELEDGRVLVGGIGLRREGGFTASADGRDLHVHTRGDLRAGGTLEIVGSINIRVMDSDSVVLAEAVVRSQPSEWRISLQW